MFVAGNKSVSDMDEIYYRIYTLKSFENLRRSAILSSLAFDIAVARLGWRRFFSSATNCLKSPIKPSCRSAGAFEAPLDCSARASCCTLTVGPPVALDVEPLNLLARLDVAAEGAAAGGWTGAAVRASGLRAAGGI